MTHRINVMHALVKFHEYIPYSLGLALRMAKTLRSFGHSECNRVKISEATGFIIFVYNRAILLNKSQIQKFC